MGLGHRFLRHAERTEGLIHLLDASQDPDGIIAAYRTIRDEMEKFGPELAARPTLLAFTKMDLTGARENAERALASIRHPAGRSISSPRPPGRGSHPCSTGCWP